MNLPDIMDDTERQLILTALEQNRWRTKTTARYLGIAKTTLLDKLNKHGLDTGEPTPLKVSFYATPLRHGRPISGVRWLVTETDGMVQLTNVLSGNSESISIDTFSGWLRDKSVQLEAEKQAS